MSGGVCGCVCGGVCGCGAKRVGRRRPRRAAGEWVSEKGLPQHSTCRARATDVTLTNENVFIRVVEADRDAVSHREGRVP